MKKNTVGLEHQPKTVGVSSNELYGTNPNVIAFPHLLDPPSKCISRQEKAYKGKAESIQI